MDKYTKDALMDNIERIVDVQKMMLANDELFVAGAEICKKSFDALIAVGFSHEESMRIVAGGGMTVRNK